MHRFFKTPLFVRKTLFLLGAVLSLSACQTIPSARETIPENIPRTADTPLVAAIPGLSVPLVFDQKDDFRRLNQMLDKEGIPSVTILYDSKKDPIIGIADLSSDKTSILELRVLPRLISAIGKENTLRQSQGLPPLGELDLVTYSQGSVISWDLFRRLIEFQEEKDLIVKAVGDEWDYFEKDPEFDALCDALINYLLVDGLKVQYPEAYNKYIDVQNIHFRAKKNFEKATARFKAYVTDALIQVPDASAPPGNGDAYPRRYPKMLKYFAENYPPEKNAGLEFFNRYALYRNLLPLKLRLFSICGSFLGSPDANAGYFFVKNYSKITNLIIGDRGNQIADTRLGTQHSLDWLKLLFEFESKMDPNRKFENIYFVAGAHGVKGDGLVEQSNAHLNSQAWTEVPASLVLEAIENPGTIKKTSDLRKKRLPFYPVSALPVNHMPQKILFFDKLGASQIDKGNLAYPYLVAFLKKDFTALEKFRKKEKEHLRQFTVLVYFRGTWERFKDHKFKLRSDSKEIKIGKCYIDYTTNAYAWTGYFKSPKVYLTPETAEAKDPVQAILEVKDPSGKTGQIEVSVVPGTSHFLEIIGDGK